MAFREKIFPTWLRMTAIERKSRRRYSDRGRLIQTSTVICGVMGLDTDLSFAYQVLALLVCILIASRFSLRFQVPEISLRRQLPRYATAGEPFEYSLTVINEGFRVERDLEITDNPKVIPPDFEQFRRSKEPGEESRNVYDRWIGFHRFTWLQRLNTGITIGTSKVPDVPIKGTTTATISATPLRRGAVHFESTTVLHPDPFALSYGVIDFDNRDQLIVLPRRYPVSRRFKFLDQRNFQPSGTNSTWSIGESDEFVSLRDYRDGDPIRKIHWASTAKRDLPMVKEFQDERIVRQTLLIDTFPQDPTIFEEVISVAASLLKACHDTDGLLDLCFMAHRTEIITAGRGHSQRSQQLEALAMLKETAAPPDELIQSMAARSTMISSCIIVFARMDSIRQRIIKAIESQGIPTTIFVVKHPSDHTPIRNDYHLLEIGKIKEDMANL